MMTPKHMGTFVDKALGKKIWPVAYFKCEFLNSFTSGFGNIRLIVQRF